VSPAQEASQEGPAPARNGTNTEAAKPATEAHPQQQPETKAPVTAKEKPAQNDQRTRQDGAANTGDNVLLQDKAPPADRADKALKPDFPQSPVHNAVAQTVEGTAHSKTGTAKD